MCRGLHRQGSIKRWDFFLSLQSLIYSLARQPWLTVGPTTALFSGRSLKRNFLGWKMILFESPLYDLVLIIWVGLHALKTLPQPTLAVSVCGLTTGVKPLPLPKLTEIIWNTPSLSCSDLILNNVLRLWFKYGALILYFPRSELKNRVGYWSFGRLGTLRQLSKRGLITTRGEGGERLSCWLFKVSDGTPGNKIFRDLQWQTRWSNGLQSQRGEKQRGCCPSFLATECDDGIATVHVEVRPEPALHVHAILKATLTDHTLFSIPFDRVMLCPPDHLASNTESSASVSYVQGLQERSPIPRLLLNLQKPGKCCRPALSQCPVQQPPATCVSWVMWHVHPFATGCGECDWRPLKF